MQKKIFIIVSLEKANKYTNIQIYKYWNIKRNI